MTDCNSEGVFEHLETISLLKSLKKQVEAGKTSLPVDVQSIDLEIENQKEQMKETIAQCGNMDEIPEAAIQELATEEIKPLDIEAAIEPTEIPQEEEQY